MGSIYQTTLEVFAYPASGRQCDMHNAYVSTGTPSVGLLPIGFFHGAEIRPITALLNDPLEMAVGGMWGIWWGFSALSMASSVQELFQNFNLQAVRSIKEAAGNCVKNVIFLIGSTAYIADWANKVKLIELVQYASAFRGVALSSSSITSIIGVVNDLWEIEGTNKKIDIATEGPAKMRLQQKQFLYLLKLAADVSIFAWAVLGVAGIAAGIAVSPAFLSGLISVGCIFWFISIAYEFHLNDEWEKLQMKVDSFIDPYRPQIEQVVNRVLGLGRE